MRLKVVVSICLVMPLLWTVCFGRGGKTVKTEIPARYEMSIGGAEFHLRLMSGERTQRILAFLQSIPEKGRKSLPDEFLNEAGWMPSLMIEIKHPEGKKTICMWSFVKYEDGLTYVIHPGNGNGANMTSKELADLQRLLAQVSKTPPNKPDAPDNK